MNRNAVILTISMIVLISGMGLSYYFAYKQIDESADLMIDEASLVASKIENVTLIPFKADLRLIYSVRNPTGTQIKMDMDADLLYGDVFIGHVVSSSQLIQPNVRSDVVVTTKIQGDIGKAIAQGSGESWSIKGTMTFTGYALGFIPITVTRTGTLFNETS